MLMEAAAPSDLIVTPRLDEWLARNPNIEPSQDVIDRVIQAELGTEQRDRTNTFSASARGSCARAQVFYYTDIKAIPRLNADLHAIFHDGTFRHMRWQSWLLESGILDDVEVSVQDDELWLTGTMDGEGTIPYEVAEAMSIHNPTKFGWELKGANSHSYRFILDKGPNANHLLQIHAYFLARPDLDVWSLCYENKDTQEVKEFTVYRDEKLLDEVRSEIEGLQAHVRSKILPPILSQCQKKQGPYKTCPFAHSCLSTLEWPKKRIKRVKSNGD